ncbi:hypothetical protein [Amycolatopsis sp. CA-230715]|uniref:hypothetical protein n=1 Tax=Amycolatopsis sp. CA-230715 TaxID=2745196 RepID=UPI001C036014|nr:hypothetical protein [Amycolatopsis sp. CA-230715]QWF81035.1 hypothetical protein HUW46_04460 [Amycolatopsis sp. CA-230715]
MIAPRLVDERVATNGEHHLLERTLHNGPGTLRVRVARDLHSAARSRAVTELLTTSTGWTTLAELPARDWYEATSGCTVATTARVLGGVADTALEAALRDHPLGIVVGERYADTAELELPQLAVWLTAEVTSFLRAHPDPVWRAVRCATVARPASRKIQLNLYGLSERSEQWESTREDQRVLADIWILIDHHNWHGGDERHRFILVIHVVTAHSAPTLLACGERPGTITTES